LGDVAVSSPRQKFSQQAYIKFDAESAKYPIRLALAIFLLVSVANQFLVLAPEATDWSQKGLLAVLITAGLYWLGRLLNEGYNNTVDCTES
jgi:hypothetical protein